MLTGAVKIVSLSLHSQEVGRDVGIVLFPGLHVKNGGDGESYLQLSLVGDALP